MTEHQQDDPLPGIFDGFKARTSDVASWVRWMAVGPHKVLFWSSMVLLVVASLVAVHLSLPGPAPSVATASKVPVMHCAYGRVAVLRAGRWYRAANVAEGRRAMSTARRGRTVLTFGDDSTVRLQGRCLFTWRHQKDGRLAFVLETGRVWVSLSALDSMVVVYPRGMLECPAGAVAEVSLHIRGPRASVVRCRHGKLKATLRVLRRQGTPTQSLGLRPPARADGAQTIAPVHEIRRFRIRRKVLHEGQGLVAMRNLTAFQITRKFKPDDPWQTWNSQWIRSSDLKRTHS